MNMEEVQNKKQLPSSSSSASRALLTDSEDEPEIESENVHDEELRHMVLSGPLINRRKRLSKQLSMCETTRDIAWERRRRQILILQERRKNGIIDDSEQAMGISDEDLNELKGCIDLGFGFNEEYGHGLTNTLPALDLYFAVNRQFSPSPVSTPSGSSSGRPSSSSFPSPKSDSDSWKICSPGDDPQQVKTKLRHWAQAVACFVKQSY
ncbi:carboxylate clamp-TPR protein [Thalictrum thalictroides]|uniref:Carboxylate clamp-TPR protein n=1 Tax=Thalictrum thalictroides TaxID=46969 RepID=A0A7J6W3A0_THATH|nr:carboxylate clamp-TPR protein [Thalictrum thalictroides]